ncbi:MAG: M14 family zinc carboxypeptidase, partial [Gemmatimonadota bacterium]
MRGTRTLAILTLAIIPSGLGAQVPSPESVLGFEVGADRRLADWNEITGYFERLATASDRVLLDTLGATTLDRPFLLLTISSPANLARLDRYRSVQAKLADPRRIASPEERERLIAEGRAVVLVTAAIHSTEVGAGQVPLRIAHRLASGDDAEVRRILDETIVLLVPSLNPDGSQKVVDWYESTLGQPWEGAAPPFLYHHYVGHDNNRDWYAFTQVETQLTVTKVHNVWHPQIVHDIHQQASSGSRFFVPPWLDPVEPNVDPLIISGANAVGTAVAWEMHAQGKTGIVVNATYDAWTPARAYQHYHAGVRILTETASARMASPIEIPFDSLRGRAGFDARERSWNFPEPWPGGTWRLADIVDYMEAGAFAVMTQAALYRERWLRGFVAIGERTVQGGPGWPEAILLPVEGTDPDALAEVLRILRTADVEVRRATRAFRARGERYAAGTYVVPMAQPYAGFAKAMLERQRYPQLHEYPGGPLKRPYDVTAHTLPLLMGVPAVHVEEPVTVPLSGVIPVPEVRKTAPGLTGAARPPRVALYQSYDPSMDEGWTRWIFDEYGIRYTTVRDADVRAGALAERFDALILPDQDPREILEGRAPETVPPEYAGGLGAVGLAALEEFVEAGGTLIAFNEASGLVLEHFDVPVRDALDGLSRGDFYAPGSILRIHVDASHPLGRGMPRASMAWVEGGLAFEPEPGADPRAVTIVARYDEREPLLSGWLNGAEYLNGKGALAVATLGRGRVVLFGFRPQYR